jgi:LmbE family N-acetylglucosaminyl deacetylase
VEMTDSVLVVVAHPDDEVLGCGATIAALAKDGAVVRCCILSSDVDARAGHVGNERLRREIGEVHALLGLEPPVLGSFPNIRFGAVPHLDLVRFIEGAIDEHGPTTVITHHPEDLNHDHRETSLACQAAARYYQRTGGDRRLRRLLYMEVPSATDWAFRGPARGFEPDTFFELGTEHLAKKLEALERYSGVMRDYPHPRSREVVEALATLRGAQAGLDRAEAYQTAFSVWSGGAR